MMPPGEGTKNSTPPSIFSRLLAEVFARDVGSIRETNGVEGEESGDVEVTGGNETSSIWKITIFHKLAV